MQFIIFAWIRPVYAERTHMLQTGMQYLDFGLAWYKEIMYKFTKIFLSLPLVRQEWVEEKTSSMIPELLSQFTLLAFPSQSILSFDVKSCWARFDENLAVCCSKQHNFMTWFSRLSYGLAQKLCAFCPVYSIKKMKNR